MFHSYDLELKYDRLFLFIGLPGSKRLGEKYFSKALLDLYVKRDVKFNPLIGSIISRKVEEVIFDKLFSRKFAVNVLTGFITSPCISE